MEPTYYFVLIFAEREFDKLHADYWQSFDLSAAFALGAHQGARSYGAGSYAAYVWPSEEGEMKENEAPEEVERALTAVAEEVERRRVADAL